MLLNREEIANLAWLDSVCFNKEDLLLVQDLTRPGAVHYEERLCRLRGNLLFILSIESPPSHLKSNAASTTINDLAIKSFPPESHRSDAVLARNHNAPFANFCDQISQPNLDDQHRLARLTELFSQVAGNNHVRLLDNGESFQPKSFATERQVLYALLLEGCGIRHSEDPSKYEFSIHFDDPLQPAADASHLPSRSLRVACHSESQCNDWLTAIRSCSYAHLKSFQRAVQRRIQVAQRVQQRLLRDWEQQNQDTSESDELVEEGTIVDESWFPEEFAEIDEIDSESSPERKGHHQRLKRRDEHALPRQPVSCSPPPQSCSSHIDSTTDEFGIQLPFGRWILPDRSSDHIESFNTVTGTGVNQQTSTDLEQDFSAIACTVQADIRLYFRQGQLPCLQARLTCFKVALQTEQSDCKQISCNDYVKRTPFWQENSETQLSLQARFAKQFHIPNWVIALHKSRPSANNTKPDRAYNNPLTNSSPPFIVHSVQKEKVWLRVQIFDVIEQLTQTRVLLGQCQQPLPVQWFHNHTQTTNDSSQFLRMHLRSSLPGDQIIGNVCVQRCSEQLPRSLLGDGTSKQFHNLQSQTTSSVDGQQNIIAEMGSETRKSSLSSSFNGTSEPATMAALVPSPLTVDAHLFVNTILRSFQFELPASDTLARKLTITELMSEPNLALQLPQTIMYVSVCIHDFFCFIRSY